MAPSTSRKPEPEGFEDIVMETVESAVGVGVGWGPLFDDNDDAKLATNMPGPFIFALVEADVVSEIIIEPDSVQEMKAYPELAVAVIGTAAASLYQLLP